MKTKSAFDIVGLVLAIIGTLAAIVVGKVDHAIPPFWFYESLAGATVLSLSGSLILLLGIGRPVRIRDHFRTRI